MKTLPLQTSDRLTNSEIDEAIPLLPVPYQTWEQEFERWETPFVRRKLERYRRVRDHIEYLNKYLPKIPSRTTHYVLDLGCADGILLEIARANQYQVLGIDAPMTNTGGMGENYQHCARLLRHRQMLPSIMVDTVSWMRSCPFSHNVDLINLRGSIEQIFSEYMDGPPHDEHHDCRELSWRFDLKLNNALHDFFTFCSTSLDTSKYLLVHANGADNYDEWEKEFQKVASFYPLKNIRTDMHQRDKVFLFQRSESSRRQTSYG